LRGVAGNVVEYKSKNLLPGLRFGEDGKGPFPGIRGFFSKTFQKRAGHIRAPEKSVQKFPRRRFPDQGVRAVQAFFKEDPGGPGNIRGLERQARVKRRRGMDPGKPFQFRFPGFRRGVKQKLKIPFFQPVRRLFFGKAQHRIGAAGTEAEKNEKKGD
jgi:hypothetical protein